MHFQVKLPHNGRKNIFRKKETTKKEPLKLLKFLQKDKNCVFGLCQQTSKVQFIHVAFEHHIISSKQGQ